MLYVTPISYCMTKTTQVSNVAFRVPQTCRQAQTFHRNMLLSSSVLNFLEDGGSIFLLWRFIQKTNRDNFTSVKTLNLIAGGHTLHCNNKANDVCHFSLWRSTSPVSYTVLCFAQCNQLLSPRRNKQTRRICLHFSYPVPPFPRSN